MPEFTNWNVGFGPGVNRVFFINKNSIVIINVR